jgi:hypothetical protein
MHQILVVCPQERDIREIRAARLHESYDVRFAGPDLDAVDFFDPFAFVEELATTAFDGVVGTKDRSALLAALLAEGRGLTSPSPQALLSCQHKPTSRGLQRTVAPEATPRFGLVGRMPPPFPPPYWVKPVVGRLSQNARQIDDSRELQLLHEDGYPDGYAAVAELAGLPRSAAHGFLAEELLSGLEVTLEGYVHRGELTVIGVTDSLKYPGTNSFERFEYPSRLPAARLAELGDVARRVLEAHEFDGGFFNMEFFVPVLGPAQVIEVNGRIASQFATLVRALHGRSTYDALFALAVGDDPAWHAGEPEGVAVSYCLRVFEDAHVAAVPDPEPGLEVLVRPGLLLSEQGTNDSQSYRLAIFAEVGATREEAVELCRERAASLAFELPAREALALDH